MTWLVETLAATALLMALVMMLRGPVARLLGPRAAYALWSAPLARIILPTVPLEFRSEAIVALDPGPPAATAQVVAETLPASTIIFILWGAGAAIFLGWHLLVYRKFVRSALASGRPAAAGQVTAAALIETSAVTGPAATGLLVRRIFVPQGFADRFSAEERELALAHETLHHRRGDLWASAAALLMLALHWFNPLAHLAHRAFRRDLEAACDASLLDLRGDAARPAYARTILRCAGQPMPHSSCALTPIGELKGRLEMLNLHHGKARRICGAAFAAALAGASVFVAQPVAAQDEPGATERVEVRRIVTHDQKGGDHLQRALPGDLREKMAKCDGEKFEADTSAPAADGKADKRRTRIMICAKAGSSKAETAAALEKVLSRVEGDSEMPAENKAQITARLKARIAELKAGG